MVREDGDRGAVLRGVGWGRGEVQGEEDVVDGGLDVIWVCGGGDASVAWDSGGLTGGVKEVDAVAVSGWFGSVSLRGS
jgi:hypothetical protein